MSTLNKTLIMLYSNKQKQQGLQLSRFESEEDDSPVSGLVSNSVRLLEMCRQSERSREVSVGVSDDLPGSQGHQVIGVTEVKRSSRSLGYK